MSKKESPAKSRKTKKGAATAVAAAKSRRSGKKASRQDHGKKGRETNGSSVTTRGRKHSHGEDEMNEHHPSTVVGSTPFDQGILANQTLEEHTRVEERASAAAARLDVETEQVEQLPFDLSVLESDGLFVNVDCKGFGMLDRRLDWGALGIKLPPNSSIAFRPPRIGVIPNKYRLPLQRPAAQAHNALNRYGYRFRLTETLFQTPEYRWIPWQALADFEAEFQTAAANLQAAKAATLEHYDEIIEDVRATFTTLAEDSARRITATTGVPFETDAAREEFCTRIIEGALALVPSRSDIEHALSLRFKPGVILLGSEMLAEQRRAAEERLRLTQVEAKTEIVESTVRERQRIEQISIFAEQERQQLQTQAVEEELRREEQAKERIRQLKLEAAREAMQETLSPLMEGMEQLHLKVYDAARQMLEALKEKEFVPGATAKSARELARWFRLMNFQNDEQLAKLVEELNQQASARKSSRSPGDLSLVLGDIVRATHKRARAAMQRNRFDALEV